jgi:hypothetical protein
MSCPNASSEPPLAASIHSSIRWWGSTAQAISPRFRMDRSGCWPAVSSGPPRQDWPLRSHLPFARRPLWACPAILLKSPAGAGSSLETPAPDLCRRSYPWRGWLSMISSSQGCGKFATCAATGHSHLHTVARDTTNLSRDVPDGPAEVLKTTRASCRRTPSVDTRPFVINRPTVRRRSVHDIDDTDGGSRSHDYFVIWEQCRGLSSARDACPQLYVSADFSPQCDDYQSGLDRDCSRSA